MNRVRLKKGIQVPEMKRINLVFVSFVIITLGVFLVFGYVNKKASPIIMDYASMEAKKLSSIIINKAISKHITEKTSGDELFEITKDSTGEIKSIDFNTALINKFLTETTNSVQTNLRNIEKGNINALEFEDTVLDDYDKKKLENGIIYEVSTGVLIGNPILANVGPRIPVKINLLGDATSNVSTKVKNYGINNALIEVYVNLKITVQVILPFYKHPVEIETKAPVALKIVTGTVPKYYSNGINQNTPTVVVPTEE